MHISKDNTLLSAFPNGKDVSGRWDLLLPEQVPIIPGHNIYTQPRLVVLII